MDTVDEILNDLKSGESRRVLSAIHEVLQSREPALFDELIPIREELERETEEIDFGGALHSNQNFVDAAFERIDAYRRGECWCLGYQSTQFGDPRKEQARGHVRIDGTSTPGWDMTYECTCLVCDRAWHVEQGTHHFTWWNWTLRE